MGQEFGHRYEILSTDDFGTSINLPLLVEFYANFGLSGVVLGMFLLGLLYRFMDHKLNGRSAGIGALLIAATIYSHLINIESDFSLTFGAITYTVLAMYLIFRFSQRPKRQPATARLGSGVAP